MEILAVTEWFQLYRTSNQCSHLPN